MQALIVGKISMGVLISQLTYIPETHTGIFLRGIYAMIPFTEVEEEMMGKLLCNSYTSVCNSNLILHLTQDILCYSN